MSFKQLLGIVSFLLFFFCTNAQDSFSFKIDTIKISGNKKTKEGIILRETTLSTNETYKTEALNYQIEQTQRNLSNISLFTNIEVNFEAQDTIQQQIFGNLKISVKERWYLFPSIYGNIIDRNFNVWWRDFDHSVRRTIYGVQLQYYNATGNNDPIKVKAQTGYRKALELNYRTNFLDKNKIYRLRPAIKWTESNELNIATEDNKQVFFSKDNEAVNRNFKASISLNRRKNIDVFQNFELAYTKEWIDSEILELNNNFFLENENETQFFELYYRYVINKTDLRYYPQNGWMIDFNYLQRGLGVFDNFMHSRFRFKYSNFFQLSKNEKFTGVVNVATQLSLQERLPYYYSDALGRGDNNIRGYELYLFNGNSFAMLRGALRYKFLDIKITNPFFEADWFSDVPFQFYFKVYNEYGKVWDKNQYESNPLNRDWLRGFGAGLDIVSFYDAVFSLEYSFNAINEKGLILQFNYSY